jgi:hypothetical protein
MADSQECSHDGEKHKWLMDGFVFSSYSLKKSRAGYHPAPGSKVKLLRVAFAEPHVQDLPAWTMVLSM